MDFSNTKLSLRRPITSYGKVQAVIGNILRNRRFHIDRKAIDRKDYLDLGCGPNTHVEFINLDYGWHPKIDICWDIARGLPLSSAAVVGIFTEHCLEHLSLEAADYVLSECWRVLKPGGSIRIIVPDGELYLTRYVQINRGQTDVRLPYFESDSYQGRYSPLMSVNRIFRSHGHVYIHDFQILRHLLDKNGFTAVRKESLRSGRDAKLLIDTESRAVESVYVEASRPALASTA